MHAVLLTAVTIRQDIGFSTGCRGLWPGRRTTVWEQSILQSSAKVAVNCLTQYHHHHHPKPWVSNPGAASHPSAA